MAKKRRDISSEQKEEALKFYRSSLTGTRPLATMQHKFRWIKTQDDIRALARFERLKTIGGNRIEKLAAIREKVFGKFLEKRDLRLTIKGRDLQRWAMQFNRELEAPLSNFKASEHWLDAFKKEKRICSRRITKFVARTYAHDKEASSASAEEFVEKVRTLMKKYGTAQ